MRLSLLLIFFFFFFFSSAIASRIFFFKASICFVEDDYDSELFLKAVKIFLKEKDKDMEFLFKYARMRKVEEKVYRILEIMDYAN